MFRAHRGENLLEAHRQHTYQQLSDGAPGAIGSVAVVTLASIAVILLGLISLNGSVVTNIGVAVAIFGVTVVYLSTPRILVGGGARL